MVQKITQFAFRHSDQPDEPNISAYPSSAAWKAALDSQSEELRVQGNSIIDAMGLGNLPISVTAPPYYASGSAQATTGSITSGLKALTVDSAIDFAAGQGINVYGKYEVASLEITAGASSSANCTVTLNAVAKTVALTSGWTATQVATAIRAATFPGWTTGGSGITVTFTSNKTGTKTDASYSAGTTSATGSMTTTTQGTEDLKSIIAAINGLVITLADAASTTVSGVVVAHDDTVAIQAAITALPSTGGVIFFPSGVYYHGNLLTGTKNVIMIGQGKALTILRRNANVVFITSIGDTTNTLTIKDMTIDGNLYKKIGISVKDVANFYLEGVKIEKCGIPGYANGNNGSIDGVFAQSVVTSYAINCDFDYNERDGFLGFPVNRLTIRNSNFTGNGRLGTANTQNDTNTNGPLSTTYDNNYFYQNGAGGIDVETHTSLDPAFFNIINNRIIDCGSNNWGYGWAIIAGVHSEGRIEGNKVLNFNSAGSTFASGILSGSRRAVRIVNNISSGCGQNGYYINQGGEGTIVEGNTGNSNGLHGCAVFDSAKVNIVNNYFSLNQQTGIDLFTTSYVVITGNHLINNSQAGSNSYSGIRTRDSTRMTIGDNEVNGTNHKYGWDLDSEPSVVNVNFYNNHMAVYVTNWWNFAGDVAIGTIVNGRKHLYKSTIPTGGTFRKADYVEINNVTTSGSTPNRVMKIGWVRITDGSGHVEYTDWFTDYLKES